MNHEYSIDRISVFFLRCKLKVKIQFRRNNDASDIQSYALTYCLILCTVQKFCKDVFNKSIINNRRDYPPDLPPLRS